MKLPKEYIKKLFVNEFKKQSEIVTLNLSTEDGFSVYQLSKKTFDVEADKIAAISSSLCAMSNSTVQELFLDKYGIINIECPSGKVVFDHIMLQEKVFLITLCCTDALSLAEARFICKRLKSRLEDAS